MDQQKVLFAVLGMTAVTYVPRLLPAWCLKNKQLPPLLRTWLQFVPAAVMAAMLAPALLLQDHRVNVKWDNVYLWAALPTFLFALRTRHFFGTIVIGCAMVSLVRYLAG